MIYMLCFKRKKAEKKNKSYSDLESLLQNAAFANSASSVDNHLPSESLKPHFRKLAAIELFF